VVQTTVKTLATLAELGVLAVKKNRRQNKQ
jgi:hypothetical protein